MQNIQQFSILVWTKENPSTQQTPHYSVHKGVVVSPLLRLSDTSQQIESLRFTTDELSAPSPPTFWEYRIQHVFVVFIVSMVLA